tara:strand:- start:831 stop:1658 length:828 start_codon:yes stop_codon:yes gene_type:complete
MPESITIKDEPTPALSLEDQANLEKTEESSTSEGSELLAGKYKSVEELEKGYQELQQKMSSGEKTEEPEPKAESESESEPESDTETTGDAKEIYGEFIGSRFEEAGIDFGGMNDRWQQTGKLTQDDYTALDGAGFNKEMVDAYLEGVQFKATQDSQLAAQQVLDIKQEFGGEKAYDDMIAWASTALTDGEKAAFDRSIRTTDLDQIKLVIGGLQSRYQSQANIEPKLIGGKAARGPVDKYESHAQVIAAMNDDRYKTDPAYRKKVEQKLSRSSVF